MRIIKEFFNPKLKCKRVGHRMVNKPATIRRSSQSYGSICDDFYADIPVCSCCGKTDDPINEKYKTHWTSVTMPDSMWDDIRNNGFLVL